MRAAPAARSRLSAGAAPYLESLLLRHHTPAAIGMDPVRWPRMFERPDDREIVAFIAAALSYGNVLQINRSLENLFNRMGQHPADFVRTFTPGVSDLALAGFKHRFNDEQDLSAFIHTLGQMLRAHGSIEGFWTAAQKDADEVGSISDRAGRFIKAALALDLTPYFPRGLEAERVGSRPHSFTYLFPAVDGPGASKRFFMFLRWAVRSDDGIDLGLWRSINPADLEFPVDTHILRLAGYLGATKSSGANARTRQEITAFFKRLAPNDPVRYDFSLCRLGILKECPRRHEIEKCAPCELRPVCLRHRKLLRSAKTSDPGQPS